MREGGPSESLSLDSSGGMEGDVEGDYTIKYSCEGEGSSKLYDV